MKQFSLYDILGVIAPGVVLTLGVIAAYPDTLKIIPNRDFSLGDFGVVVLVSYVIGNLVAALGNFLETPYWKLFGGQPTDAVRENTGKVIATRQFQAVESKLKSTGMLTQNESILSLSAADWRALTRQIRAYLDARNMTRRIEIFNAQYGMNRGIAAGFIALAVIMTILSGVQLWRTQAVLLTCAALAAYRMHRFSWHYAAELFRQFLVAPQHAQEKKPAEGQDS
jgi:hypothetical protein